MAKINVYQIVNAPKISSAAPPEIKSVGAALNANTTSINSLGKSFSSIAALSGGLKNVAVASLKESKLKEIQDRRAKQREEDRKREEDFENRKSLVPEKDVEKQKKPTGKEKSWLEKTFGGLFGWLAPLAKGALALFGFILASQAYKDIQRMLSDPQARARIQSFFEKLKFVWDKIFSFGTWLVRDNLLAGFENVFGKDKTAVERIKGIGQILIGIIGLKALFNPFGLMGDIMSLMQTRGRELRRAQNQVQKQNQLINQQRGLLDDLDVENQRLRSENKKLREGKGDPRQKGSGQQQGAKGTAQGASTAQRATRASTGFRNTLQGQLRTYDKVAKSKRFIIQQKLRVSLKKLRRGIVQRGITSMPRIDPTKAFAYRGNTVPYARQGAVQATRGSRQFINGRLFGTEVKQFNIVKTRMGVFKQRLRIFGGKAARFAKLGPTSGVRKFFTSWANFSAPLVRGLAKIAKFTPRAVATIAKISFKGASAVVKGTGTVLSTGAKVVTTTAKVGAGALRGLGSVIKGLTKVLGRIPWIGVILEAFFNLLDFSKFEETGNFKDITFDLSKKNVRFAAYKGLGFGIGGALGSFIFPPFGTIIGGMLGSKGAEYAFRIIELKEDPLAVGKDLVGDAGKLWEGLVKGGGVALEWAKTGMARLYELFPKIRLAEHLPDWLIFKDWLLTTEPFRSILDAQLPDVGRMAQNIGSGLVSGANAFMNFAGQIGTAFFSDEPITPGDKRNPTEHEKPDENAVDQASLIKKNYGFTKGKRVWFKIEGVDYQAVKEEEGWSFDKRTNDGLFNFTGYQDVETRYGKNPWVITNFEKAMADGNYTLTPPTERRTLQDRSDVNIENLGGFTPGLSGESERMDQAAKDGKTMPAAKLLEMGYTQAVVDAVDDPLNPKMNLGAQFKKNFGKKNGQKYYFTTTGGNKYQAVKTGQGFQFYHHKEGFLGFGFGYGAGIPVKTEIGKQVGFINEFVTRISRDPKGEDDKRTKAEAVSTTRTQQTRSSLASPDQSKTAILAYGTNEWSQSRDYITGKTKELIAGLTGKGYKVVVIPPSPKLVVFKNGKGVIKNPHDGVTTAAAESGAQIHYGDYAENDNLGHYVHLKPEHAKTLKSKYGADIVVGDSNAALINGGQSSTTKDGAAFAQVSRMIGGMTSVAPSLSSGDTGDGYTPSVSLAGGKEKAILNLIASVEQEASGYDSVNGEMAKKPTECTIREIASYAHLRGRSGSGAAGRYQHMPAYIAGRAVNAGFDSNTLFTPGVQDKITITMLNDGRHRMQDFLAKKMSAEAFGTVLAGTWRGFPQGPINAARFPGSTEDQTYSDSAAGRNAAKDGYKWKNFLKDLQRIQGSSAANADERTQGDSQNLGQIDASVGGVDLTPYLDVPPSEANEDLNLTAQHGDPASGGPIAKDPGFNAGAGDKTKRIFLHWTGGFHNGTSTRYHTTFTGDGTPHRNTKDYGVRKNNHTGGANGNSVGLSIAAMGHKGMRPDYYDPAKGFAESPPTIPQLNAMALEAARLAHAWGWTEATIQTNVKTHGEWERYATSNNLLPGAPQRWDLDQLRPSQPFDDSKIMSNGGKEMRALITAYYRKIVQQEKGNNGLGQDGQALQPTIELSKNADGTPVAGTLMDGVLVVPPSMANGNVPLLQKELIQMVKLLGDGSLQAFQAPKNQMGGIMEALGKGLNLAQAATGVVTNAAGELFRRAQGALQGDGSTGSSDGTTSPSSDPTQIPGDNPYGLQSQLDKDGNPIGFGEFARSQAPMDTPLTDTYNTLHKQWEAVLGIDPDGHGYKPRDVDRSDIFRNDYGGRTLSVEQGLGILFKRLGDENEARKGTTGIGPIADGDVYGSLIPSYSVGGKVTPMPNNLEGFFLGKVFKSIGKAISGAFNAVKNAVTSITNNPIFKVVTTAVSIFVPALAPVIAGINAVSSLMQGDILGAVVGGVGALGGMFPGTFGTEAGTFWSGLNKTFGEGLGGVMKGFLTGGIGGAIGSIGGMLPDGMKAFFSGMGSFMDKNPMVKNILSAGIANIPGLGQLLGPALEGAGLSPTAAIDQSAQGAGTLISSLLNVGLGLVSKAMGMEQAAISVGALPEAFGVPMTQSAGMDPKNEAMRQMAQMGPIEVVHVPVIIEKLVAIREPVPIVTTRVVQKPAPQQTQPA